MFQWLLSIVVLFISLTLSASQEGLCAGTPFPKTCREFDMALCSSGRDCDALLTDCRNTCTTCNVQQLYCDLDSNTCINKLHVTFQNNWDKLPLSCVGLDNERCLKHKGCVWVPVNLENKDLNQLYHRALADTSTPVPTLVPTVYDLGATPAPTLVPTPFSDFSEEPPTQVFRAQPTPAPVAVPSTRTQVSGPPVESTNKDTDGSSASIMILTWSLCISNVASAVVLFLAC